MNLNAYSGGPSAVIGAGGAGPCGSGLDDHSGTMLDGTPVTDLEVIDLVRAAGSLTIVRGPAQRLRRSAWTEQIGILMDGHDLRASIRDSGRLVLILDLDWAGWAPSAPEPERNEPASRAAHPSGWARPRALPDLPT